MILCVRNILFDLTCTAAKPSFLSLWLCITKMKCFSFGQWMRKSLLFVVLILFNEEFTKISNSVIKNIAHLCGRTRSKTWGPEGWKKVVVCVVSDGRNKVNKRTLQVLTLVTLIFPSPIIATDYNWVDGIVSRRHSERFRSGEGCHGSHLWVCDFTLM